MKLFINPKRLETKPRFVFEVFFIDRLNNGINLTYSNTYEFNHDNKSIKILKEFIFCVTCCISYKHDMRDSTRSVYDLDEFNAWFSRHPIVNYTKLNSTTFVAWRNFMSKYTVIPTYNLTCYDVFNIPHCVKVDLSEEQEDRLVEIRKLRTNGR